MNDFPLHVKSTIDKIVFDLASVHGFDVFDIDGVYTDVEKVESEKPAMVVSLSSISEHPRDPFWNIQFEVGAKTSNDSAQYGSIKILSILQSMFSVGSSFPVADYSGEDLPTQNVGEMHIALATPTAPVFDRVSGLRMIQVTASAQRFFSVQDNA